MKIGLVSTFMKDNDIVHQLSQITQYVSSNHNCDILCFGESFLQGFEGLTWNYYEDINRALSKEDKAIIYLKELARSNHCAISFGFIEKENSIIYSSNMVIDEQGEIIDIYRRRSAGWKEPIANEQYQEGNDFHTFDYKDKQIGVAICGDLWDDKLINELEGMKMDALIWPLYVDFSIESWNEEFLEAYTERIKKLPYPAYMINSFVQDVNRANGGCYVFHKKKVSEYLAMGDIGILTIDM